MALRITVVALLLALLQALLPLRDAHAEEMEETEFRLKTAGIEAPLRKRIHAAIEKAVTRLRALRRKRHNTAAGRAALMGLALRHAGTPEALAGAKPIIEYVTGGASRRVLSSTYEAGIGAMLLHADRSHADFSRRIHQNLAAGTGISGYWGYSSAGSSGPNLSTAQYGALGLWACERQGAPVAKKTWRKHLLALARYQQGDGSWAYVPMSARIPLRFTTYPTGTLMGYANLVLASRSLAEEIAEDDKLTIPVLLARARAEVALRRDVQRMLASPNIPSIVGRQALYSIFAMEKACVFSGQRRVGGVEWYREGALLLLETQAKDGGWAEQQLQPAARRSSRASKHRKSDVVGTSFALLFLLRASESYRPISPRPVDRKAVVTGGETGASKAEVITRNAPHLGLATRILDKLDATLEQPKLKSVRPVLSAFRFIRRAYPGCRKGDGFVSPEHDAWCRRAEQLLLEASTRFSDPKVSPHRDWLGIGFDALATLAVTHPRIGPQLMQRITALKRNKRFPGALRIGWYGTAVETLRHMEPNGLDLWLSTHAATAEPEEADLSSAALVALGGRARAMTGPERYTVAAALLESFKPLAQRGLMPETRSSVALRAFRVTMQRLAEAGGAHDFPRPTETQRYQVSAGAVLGWWQRHKKPSDPVWQGE